MKMYNAAVEVATKKISEDTADELMEALAAYHPSVGTSTRGWLEARISVPAESLLQASTTALAVVEQATGVAAIYAEVMAEEEFAAREGFTVEPDIVSSAEAAKILHVSGARIRQLAAGGRLQEIPTEGRSKVFTRSSVLALASQDRGAGRPRKVDA